MRKPSCLSTGSPAEHAEQVENRDGEEEPVKQNRDAHDHQASVAHLDGARQREPVELYDQHAVDEARYSAQHRDDGEQYQRLLQAAHEYPHAEHGEEREDRGIQLALRPEPVLEKPIGLQRVGRDPANHIPDGQVGGEQSYDSSEPEEIRKPRPHDLAESFALGPNEVELLPDVLAEHCRVGKGRHDGDGDYGEKEEGPELLLIGDPPPTLPPAHVFLVLWEEVPDVRTGLLFPSNR